MQPIKPIANLLIASAAITGFNTSANEPSYEFQLPEAPKSLPEGDQIHTYQLNNGLDLLVKTDKRAPVVLAQIWYKVGASYEPAGLTGISHMLEHMMFKGTKQFPPGKIDELVEEHGGSQNAFTAYDYTSYYQFWGNNQLDLSLKIESSRMNGLLFDQKKFEKEKQVVKEERRMRVEDNPIAFAYERLASTAFANNPRSHPVIGWMGDIDQYQLNDVQSWYQKWYAPNNATLVVVGDVNPDTVYQKVKHHFKEIPSEKLPETKKHIPIPPAGEKQIDVHHSSVNVPTLLMGYQVPAVKSTQNTESIYALMVLEKILGGMSSSRLQKNLVRNQMLAASVQTSYEAFALNDTLFTIIAIPSGDHSLKSLKTEIENQIRLIQKNGIEQAELDRVKTDILATKIYMQDSITSQASLLGSFASLGLSPQYMHTFLNRMLKVTPEQVQKAASQYLKTENLTTAFLTQKPDKQQVDKQKPSTKNNE